MLLILIRLDHRREKKGGRISQSRRVRGRPERRLWLQWENVGGVTFLADFDIIWIRSRGAFRFDSDVTRSRRCARR